MTLTASGRVTLGVCIPIAVEAQAQIVAGVSPTLAELKARLNGQIEVQARLVATPPSLAASLAIAKDLVVSIEAAIALGVPDAMVDVSAIGAAVLELEAIIGTIEAALDFAASLQAQLAAGGLYLYKYSGTAPTLGGEVTLQLASGLPGTPAGATVHGVLILASEPAAVAALQAGFGITV